MSSPNPAPTDATFDFVIIGSGFGGSVSALRLAQKGYRVAVIERGKRYRAQDFPRSNWNAPKFLWAPKLRCFGFQAITVLRDVMVLHGAGVGGGSLVYANVLLSPPDEVFDRGEWPKSVDWRAALRPHYATARRMLGVNPATGLGPGDEALREVARSMNREDTFHTTDVAVFFGKPDVWVDDPYFDGEGPRRAGCNHCGGCMTGCRFDGKNTLDKNYLFLAEKLGVQVFPETEVTDVRPAAEGEGEGYVIETRRITDWVFKRKHSFRAGAVVFAGGALGTVPLLFRCKESGSLPNLSDKIGYSVRTNSEALVGAINQKDPIDHSRGVAIASGFFPDDDTHVELVRYGAGQDAMGLLGTSLTPGTNPWGRRARWLLGQILHPLRAIRSFIPVGFAKNTAILLVMQSIDNSMRLLWRRRWWWPFSRRLDSRWRATGGVPKKLPVADDTARAMAKEIRGRGMGSLLETVLDVSSTAHILGGCPMGETPAEGVIDPQGKVFGYDNLYIADGSVIPANLGVNPSLTITALSEWVMSHVPKKDP